MNSTHSTCPTTPMRVIHGSVTVMDEGLPVAYEVLESGVPVYASSGEQVGTVDHVVAAEQLDIFHGLVIRVGDARRFVPADQVASLHERGADLRIDAGAVAELEPPQGGAPAWREVEPGVKPSGWRRFLDLIEGKDPRARGWKQDE